MVKGDPYIRKKGNKFVIERKVDGRTEYIKTLPPMKELLKIMGIEASLYYEEENTQNLTQSVQNNEASS